MNFEHEVDKVKLAFKSTGKEITKKYNRSTTMYPAVNVVTTANSFYCFLFLTEGLEKKRREKL